MVCGMSRPSRFAIRRRLNAAQGPLSRAWYVVALILAVAGWGGVALFLIVRLSGVAEGMIHVLVPGTIELRLKESGRYTIFHEYRSTFEGRIYNVDRLAGLQISLRSRAGATVPLTQSSATSYTVDGRSGRSLYQFEIAEPGAYELVALYSDGRREPQTVLAIDRGFVGGLLTTIFLALAMGLAATVPPVAIAGVVFAQRQRLKRQSKA